MDNKKGDFPQEETKKLTEDIENLVNSSTAWTYNNTDNAVAEKTTEVVTEEYDEGGKLVKKTITRTTKSNRPTCTPPTYWPYYYPWYTPDYTQKYIPHIYKISW